MVITLCRPNTVKEMSETQYTVTTMLILCIENEMLTRNAQQQTAFTAELTTWRQHSGDIIIIATTSIFLTIHDSIKMHGMVCMIAVCEMVSIINGISSIAMFSTCHKHRVSGIARDR